MKDPTRITWRRPLAIHPRALDEDLFERTAGVADRGFAEEGDAAVVEIRGPLMQRASGFWSLFCDDYDSIRERVAAALASPAKRVIMRIDSPGGDASGCLELAREIRAMAKASGKRLLAFGEGILASAAYAIASAADEIHTMPTTLVGSVGCIATLVDVTALDASMGVKFTLVVSGERKADGNPHAPTTDAVVARAQAMVDELATIFFGVVTDHRPMTLDQVKALGGGLLVGASAVGAGLADHVSTWAEVLAGTYSETTAPSAETKEGSAMAEEKKDYKSTAKESLRAIVDDEKASAEDREQARKALRALEAEPTEKKDDEKTEPESKAGAEGGEKKDEMRAAAAAPVTDVAAVARKAALEAVTERERVQAEAAEVRELLSTRPDFDAAVKATLSKLPVAEVRTAVKEWPRRAALAPAAGANAMPTTHGASQGDLDYAMSADDTALMNRIMRHDGANAPKSQAEQASATFDFAAARKRADALRGKEAR